MGAVKRATLWIPGRLPSLNDLMLDRGQRIQGKKQWRLAIAALANADGTPRFERGAHVHIECVEPNEKRDPDGFTGGAAKVVLDAFKHCGVLNGDGWKHVRSLAYGWRVDKDEPGVLVTLVEPEELAPVPKRRGRKRV